MIVYWIEINIASRNARPKWRQMQGAYGEELHWTTKDDVRAAFAAEGRPDARIMSCGEDGVFVPVYPEAPCTSS